MTEPQNWWLPCKSTITSRPLSKQWIKEVQTGGGGWLPPSWTRPFGKLLLPSAIRAAIFFRPNLFSAETNFRQKNFRSDNCSTEKFPGRTVFRPKVFQSKKNRPKILSVDSENVFGWKQFGWYFFFWKQFSRIFLSAENIFGQFFFGHFFSAEKMFGRKIVWPKTCLAEFFFAGP